jgi:TRAP-type C4-dicarboxylate transport system substrate-binding protein
VLTDHLVDAIYLSMSGQTWKKLSDAQKQKVMAAALKARQFNNDNRIKDEKELAEFFKKQGLEVYAPDVAAFRKHVQEAYLKSPFAKDWAPGIVEKVNAVK